MRSHQLKIFSIFVAISKNVLWLNSFVFLQLLKCQTDLKTVHGTGYHLFPHFCFYGLNFSGRRMTGIVVTWMLQRRGPTLAWFSWRHMLNIVAKIGFILFNQSNFQFCTSSKINMNNIHQHFVLCFLLTLFLYRYIFTFFFRKICPMFVQIPRFKYDRHYLCVTGCSFCYYVICF